MSDTTSRIVILGAGYSGASLAVELHRRGRRPLGVTLVGATDDFARGTAYSTPYVYHLLNVPAGKMSGLADEPDHLVQWLAAHHPGEHWNEGDPQFEVGRQFIPRQLYGAYLRDLLDTTRRDSAAGVTVERVADPAVAVERVAETNAWRIRLASGRELQADTVVLATGNEAPAPLLGDLPEDVFLNNPWQWETLRSFAAKESLLLVGTGLTMVDVALVLADEGHAGTLTALSRRGLLPRAHKWEVAPTTFAVDVAAAAGPAQLRGQLEQHLAAHPEEDWRAAIDSLRPHTQNLWRSWSPDAQASFLKEHRAHWDVRRHRIAPDIARQLDALRDNGRLEVLTAGVVSAEPTPDGQVRVTIAPSDAPQDPVVRTVHGVINCTGPNCDITADVNPVYRSLLDAGHLRPDTHRLGIDVDAEGAVRSAEGNLCESLFALGPLTKSQLWEIVAVPDIRQQTAALATRLID